MRKLRSLIRRDTLREDAFAGAVGTENVYTSDEWVGATLKRAYADALGWVAANRIEDQDPDT